MTGSRAIRVVPDTERRARLAIRHGLGPGCAYSDVAAATRGMTAWHATELPSVHLAIRARAERTTVADVDAALEKHRSLIKQLGMRRTIFAVDRDLLPAVIAGPGLRVSGAERRRLVKELAQAEDLSDAESWLATAESEILAALDGQSLTTAQVRAAVPQLDRTIAVSPGTKWGQDVPVAPRVLTILAAAGSVARGANATHWRVSKPVWTTMDTWLGSGLRLPDARTAYEQLVRRWLGTFGPGTEDDIVWWLGSTKTAVRTALADLAAAPVELEGGEAAWLLPDDLEPVPDPGPWVALLPSLDPTTMGWRGRSFYLDPDDKRYLFDSVGNAVPTVWADGRLIGTWGQVESGDVRAVLRHNTARRTDRLLREAVADLERFLDGDRVPSTYARALLAGKPLP